MASALRSDSADMTIAKKLEPWINNPPDYYEMIEAYKEMGRINAAIKRKQREISRAEENVTAEIDRPRSNDAKKAKLAATVTLKDELADLEADFAIVEAQVKALEFMKVMFNASNYRTRLATDF